MHRNINSSQLLAKSSNGDFTSKSALLLGHLQMVQAAMDGIVDCVGGEMLRACGLPVSELDRLRRVGRLAAALHDVGKANDHFQRMIHAVGVSKFVQGMRHEWVMYWLGIREPFLSWGIQAARSELDWAIALWAISGHHPAYERSSPPTCKPDSSTEPELTVLTKHYDFKGIVDWLSSLADRPVDFATLAAQNPVLKVGNTRLNAFSEFKSRRNQELWNQCTRDDKRFAAVVKACLVAADVAGSYVGDKAVSDELPIGTVLAQVARLKERPDAEDLEAVVRERLNGKPERHFQTDVASSTSRVTFVKAGCGSGKTAAAYLWAARQCPGQRLYFCYPTTGTATEGFRDYLFDEATKDPKLGARLFHSRAEVDADLILHVDREGDSENYENERWQRADSMTAWGTPVVVCTVDQVLGLLQNQRKGLMTWPALAQAAFVFDEIHAYDKKMFGLLLTFIEELRGIKVLLMTASLPEVRYRALVSSLGKWEPNVPESDLIKPIEGPQDLEELPRYHRVETDDVIQLVRDEVRRGGRVLWVCNTVDRAMQAADQVHDLEPMIYHSRFKYEDRVAQHSAVVGSFKLSTQCGGCVAISTQVAEMSLDLQAATLLVTDLCPVPSFIQRLGRLNRAAVPPKDGAPPPPTRPFCVIEPLNDKGEFYECPYDIKSDDYGDWPKQTREWLGALGQNGISQADLARAWESNAGDELQSERCCWIEGGPSTTVDSVREASRGITVLLPGDGVLVRTRKVELSRVAVPMPLPGWLKGKWQRWPRFNGVPEVPSGLISYDPKRGAQWGDRDSD